MYHATCLHHLEKLLSDVMSFTASHMAQCAELSLSCCVVSAVPAHHHLKARPHLQGVIFVQICYMAQTMTLSSTFIGTGSTLVLTNTTGTHHTLSISGQHPAIICCRRWSWLANLL